MCRACLGCISIFLIRKTDFFLLKVIGIKIVYLYKMNKYIVVAPQVMAVVPVKAPAEKKEE